ncbi:MAG: hypothetical protein AB7O59_06585 [Pirellulales bacterium]
MWNPGKLVIVAILAVGLIAAGFSLWYHRQGGKHALEYWGTQGALLIARAPEIEVLKLRAADAPPAEGEDPQAIERLGVGGKFYVVTAKTDASHARGVSNIRRAMVVDGAYQWDQAPPSEPPVWQYGLEFHENDQQILVLFDFDGGRVGSTASTQTVPLVPEAVRDWRSFFEEQFAGPE